MESMIKAIKNFFFQPYKWRSLVVSVLILAMLVLPMEAQAIEWKGALTGGTLGVGIVTAVGIYFCGLATFGTCWIGFGLAGLLAGAGGFISGGADFAAALVAFFVNLISFLTSWALKIFVELTGAFLQAVIKINTQGVMNPDDIAFQVILNAAAVATSLANLFLIAILIAVGMATIVGIESYGVRKILPLLIGIVLIVNFSTVFVGLVIDAGNTAMRFLWEQSAFSKDPKFSLSKYVIRNMEISETQMGETKFISTAGSEIGATEIADKSLAQAASQLFLLFMLLLMGYIFIRLAILFTLRIGIFWILVMTAPIVFVAGVLPIGRSYLKDWWKQLLNWSFLGPIVFFFLFFGIMLWTQLNLQLRKSPVGEDIPSTIVIVFPIVMLFFMYALNISKKMAGTAANAVVDSVIGLGKAVAVGGLALGAGAVLAGTGGALLRNPFIKKTYEKLQQSRSPFLQAAGTRLEAAHKGAVEERQKRAKGAYSGLDALSNEDLIRRVKEGSFTKEQIVTAAQILDERKQTLPADVAARALKLAPSINKDVEKKLKRSAPNVRYSNEKFKDTGNIDVASAYNYMKTQNVRALELSPEALETPAVAALLDLKQLYEVARRGTPQQLASISKGFEELAKQNNMQLNIASAIGKDRAEFAKSISEIAKKVREEAIFKAGAVTEQDKPPDFTIGGAPPTT